MAAACGQLGLGPAQLGDERLGRLETLGDDLLGRPGGAAGDELDGVLGGLGLDHHDRDVAGLEHAAGDDHVEGGALELACVGKPTHWPSMSATRVPPTGPLNGRPEICVDADAALIASTS